MSGASVHDGASASEPGVDGSGAQPQGDAVSGASGTSTDEAWQEEYLEALNTEHDDAILFVARHLVDVGTATSARGVAVDLAGMEVELRGPDGTVRHRIDFPEPLPDPAWVNGAMMGLLGQARAADPDAPLTSVELEIADLNGIRTYVTQVVATAEVNPKLRQLTLGGGDLARFDPASPDAFVYLLAPPPGRTELTIDTSFTWEQVALMPPEEQPVGAYYTVRRWRPEVAEVDLLVVLHDDAGPGAAWASTAEAGAPAALWGPRTHYEPPAGTDWLLLVADETALPGAASIIEQRPEGMPVVVVAEVGDESVRQELPEGPDVTVHWVHRDGAAPGTSLAIVDAVRALEWPAGTPYVWGGGESRIFTRIRKHLRNERGLPREAVSLVAYWRHATGAAS